MSLISEDEKARSPMWAINPRSRRMILRDGPTYARLVKMGEIEDEDLRRQWSEKREADRARRIAAATEARVLGLGPSGGHPKARQVLGEAMQGFGAPQNLPQKLARPPPEPAQPPIAAPAGRRDVRELVLEHREALTRPGLTKAEALEMLRAARASREPEPEPEPGRAPGPGVPEPKRTAGGRWAIKPAARSGPRD